MPRTLEAVGAGGPALAAFAAELFAVHGETLSDICPRPFESEADLLELLTQPPPATSGSMAAVASAARL